MLNFHAISVSLFKAPANNLPDSSPQFVRYILTGTDVEITRQCDRTSRELERVSSQIATPIV